MTSTGEAKGFFAGESIFYTWLIDGASPVIVVNAFVESDGDAI